MGKRKKKKVLVGTWSIKGLNAFLLNDKMFQPHLSWSLCLFFKAQMVELTSAAGWLQGILLCSEELSSCSFPLYFHHFLMIQAHRKILNLFCISCWLMEMLPIKQKRHSWVQLKQHVH